MQEPITTWRNSITILREEYYLRQALEEYLHLPDDYSFQEILSMVIWKYPEILKNEQKQVLTLRFGLFNSPCYSRIKTAEIMKIPANKAYSIESRACQLLRSHLYRLPNPLSLTPEFIACDFGNVLRENNWQNRDSFLSAMRRYIQSNSHLSHNSNYYKIAKLLSGFGTSRVYPPKEVAEILELELWEVEKEERSLIPAATYKDREDLRYIMNFNRWGNYLEHLL
jgi:hypothetical protein